MSSNPTEKLTRSCFAEECRITWAVLDAGVLGRRRCTAAGTLVSVALMLAGCTNFRASSGSTVLPPGGSAGVARHPYVLVYDRAHHTFKEAILCLPRDGSTVGPVADLAPLIVHEVSAESEVGAAFGALRSDDTGSLWVDPDEPAVYYETGSVEVNGVRYTSLIFRWYYGSHTDFGRAVGVQAVHLVLDGDGFPLVYEAVRSPTFPAEPSDPRNLFVSRSFELAARAAFGDPLPRRRYAAERGLEDPGQSVVIRVLEDGPLPMGPYVYIDATNRVTTLACRCSPSQMDRVLKSEYYDLIAFEEVRDLAAGIPIVGSPDAIRVFEERISRPLDSGVRWPSTLGAEAAPRRRAQRESSG